MTKVERLRKETYEEACSILNEHRKCAIIRPTGFGKTGILTDIIKSGVYKKILYLYPSQVVKDAVLKFYYGDKKKDSIDNVIFMTYMAITNLSETVLDNLMDIDLIICDECHRLGAPETMLGMRDLIAINPMIPILGATATPERMDMVDEIAIFFDDRVTSLYTLHDAFQDGIIPKPFYVFCGYDESNPKVLEKLKNDALAETKYMNDGEKSYSIELIDSRMIEISYLAKMETVIEETLKETKTDTTYQKYIVFFKDFAHMRKAKKNVKKWFKNVFPTHKINELIISSETREYHRNVYKLDDLVYKKNQIDLIYTCEMLNLGYHIDDLTGIMMYRGTNSGIIYAQQLGRVLNSSDNKPKIVFDIVDNIHRKSLYTMLGEYNRDTYELNEEQLNEYNKLVNRSMEKDENGNLITLTDEETKKLNELKKTIKKKRDVSLGKSHCNMLYPEDLIVSKYSASYTELIDKVVKEQIDIRCKQAFNRWIERGGDASVLTREYILSKDIQDVPLKPFCELKNVTLERTLRVNNVE